eukprot:scaffold24495_cov86-Phaeocystis_antarctica.AAC.1
MQSAAAARSQRCTRLTILLDWHAAHVGGAASGANRGAGSVAACFAMSARSQTPARQGAGPAARATKHRSAAADGERRGDGRVHGAALPALSRAAARRDLL